jgi:tetratricopeptide (TPR) repeat protein
MKTTGRSIFCIAISAFLFITVVNAQQGARQIAKDYIRQGDYANAVLVLNRALENDAENIEIRKDLSFAYYLQGDLAKASNAIKPVVESRAADVQTFQIMGMIYKAQGLTREAERNYRIGIRKFPESGVLYNDYGELLWERNDFAIASKQWLKGIQNDQNYSGNYYNAARYYYMTQDKVWGLIYAEMFLNLESYSKRTPEIKKMLVEGYKKLFSETDMSKNQDNRNAFVKAYLEISKKHAHVVSEGITPDALTALRTRFLLSWYEKGTPRLPFRLFDYHRQLARTGMFDAYNQWIFGAASNLSTFQQWTATHSEEYNRFASFQRSRVFKVPDDQWYNK